MLEMEIRWEKTWDMKLQTTAFFVDHRIQTSFDVLNYVSDCDFHWGMIMICWRKYDFSQRLIFVCSIATTKRFDRTEDPDCSVLLGSMEGSVSFLVVNED